MPTLGKPLFNLEAPCQDHELIMWKLVVENYFKAIEHQMTTQQPTLGDG